MIKICLIGSTGTGKSNIKRVIMGKRFKRDLSPTIGSDFSFKTVETDIAEYKSVIWDLSGSRRYKLYRSLYLQGMQGCMLVFDLTKIDTLSALNDWLNDIEQSMLNKSSVPMLLVGNKSDLLPISEEQVTDIQIREMLINIRSRFSGDFMLEYVATSASTGENIESSFLKLLSNIHLWLDNRKNPQ